VTAPLLEVRDLTTEFRTPRGIVRAVDGVSLAAAAGAIVGVVGESGCGKSVTALSLMRLVPPPPDCSVAGTVELEGRDLLALSEAELRRVRGRAMAMVFQEPMTALNPVYSVGEQIAESLRAHEGLGRGAARERVVALLAKVGIPEPAARARAYPHQLSGGMRQRAMIAMALACRPKVLIADEPTTALDVTIQAQILELIVGLTRELGMAVLLSTHDLGVVAETCDEVVVMYAGQVVERSPAAALFEEPRHPYTAGLLRSATRTGARAERLREIPGVVPPLDALPAGCRFADRCPRVEQRCRAAAPPLAAAAGREVRCFYPGEARW
jgi:oligopeptide/dipeptide ABC transporter ATP-binding protein